MSNKWKLSEGLLSLEIEESLSYRIIAALQEKIKRQIPLIELASESNFEFVNRASRMCMSLIQRNELVDLSEQDILVLESMKMDPDFEWLYKVTNRCRSLMIRDGGPKAIVSSDSSVKSIARIFNG